MGAAVATKKFEDLPSPKMEIKYAITKSGIVEPIRISAVFEEIIQPPAEETAETISNATTANATDLTTNATSSNSTDDAEDENATTTTNDAADDNETNAAVTSTAGDEAAASSASNGT